jgi:ferredoxin
MKEVSNSKKLKASVNNEKCMGCGLCIIGCEQKALIFDLVKPPEYLSIDQKQEMLPAGEGKIPVWYSFTSAP